MQAVASRSRGRSAPLRALLINAPEDTFQNGGLVLLTLRLNIFVSSQESHKRAQREKVESLDEDQLFVAELARDLERVCQVRAREWDRSSSGWEQSANNVKARSLSSLFCLCRGQRSWSTSGSRMTSGPPPFAGPSSGSGPLSWRAKRSGIFAVYWWFLRLFSQSVCVCVSARRRGPCRQMAGQRWMSSNRPDWLMSRMPSRPNLWSSTGSRTWELSLRWERLFSLSSFCGSCDLLNRFVSLSAKCVARRTCGKGSGGPAVGLAVGPCPQSAASYGDGHVGPRSPEPR